MKEGVIKGNIELINPKKTLKIDNYAMNIQNMEIYEDFDKLKELINNEYKEKYNRVEKIIRTGTIDKEGWYKINKLFEEAKKTEIYSKDYMSDDIINYYKELYGNNPLRKIMNHEELKVKISRILDTMNQNTNEKNKIWPPSSTARDYNGFSQKTIEQIIRDESLEKELVKYNFLLSVISNNQETNKLFLHTVSKSILFKKRENIRGGVDIRVINILPAWLIILKKLCISKIKELLCNKIKMMQYRFIQGGDCNLAKIMV